MERHNLVVIAHPKMVADRFFDTDQSFADDTIVDLSAEFGHLVAEFLVADLAWFMLGGHVTRRLTHRAATPMRPFVGHGHFVVTVSAKHFIPHWQFLGPRWTSAGIQVP
jgi:hypothetical protein